MNRDGGTDGQTAHDFRFGLAAVSNPDLGEPCHTVVDSEDRPPVAVPKNGALRDFHYVLTLPENEARLDSVAVAQRSPVLAGFRQGYHDIDPLFIHPQG
jgi:hypothetical protein